MRKIRGKKAAIELSMTTMIVVVLSLTLLIMGFVFIRSIMCSAIGVTEEIGNQVDREVERLFSTSSGELNCIGAEGQPVTMTPGLNTIHCIINAKTAANYRITYDSIEWLSTNPALRSIDLDSWIIKEGDNYDVVPGDDTGLKPIKLNIPEDAPEEPFSIKLKVTKDGGQGVSGSKELDFRITRTGVVQNVLC